MGVTKFVIVSASVLVGGSLVALSQIGPPTDKQKCGEGSKCEGCPPINHFLCELDETCCFVLNCVNCTLVSSCCADDEECRTGVDDNFNPFATCLDLS